MDIDELIELALEIARDRSQKPSDRIAALRLLFPIAFKQARQRPTDPDELFERIRAAVLAERTS
jgi:hypothetical protein